MNTLSSFYNFDAIICLCYFSWWTSAKLGERSLTLNWFQTKSFLMLLLRWLLVQFGKMQKVTIYTKISKVVNATVYCPKVFKGLMYWKEYLLFSPLLPFKMFATGLFVILMLMPQNCQIYKDSIFKWSLAIRSLAIFYHMLTGS